MKHGKLWARILSVVCVLAMILPMISTALAATYPYDAISMDDVNLRKNANTTSTVLKKIKAGDLVSILGATGQFYRVKFDGKTGYAMKQYIDGTTKDADKPFDPTLAQSAPAAIYEYPYDTVVLQNVKLRKTAEAEGDVIRMLLAGSMVEVLDRTSNGFAKVKAEGKTGYVVDTHINLADIPAPTPVPTATPAPGSEHFVELSKGSSGSAVTALQTVLAELGYMQEKQIDGKFGSSTESALKTFQKRNGRTQDGVATPALQAYIYTGTPKDYNGYRQNVKTVAPIPNPTIREGGKGEAVFRLQNRLKELGYYEGELNSVFDKTTIAAWKMFEGRNGLTADGEVSAEDQNMLYGATALDASVVIPEPTIAPPTRTLRYGDAGEDVKGVQNRLTELGFYTGTISGTYSRSTEDAVKAFQKKSGLEADGVLGAITRSALYGQYAVSLKPTATPAPDAAYEPITKENVIIIRSGTIGNVVLRLQTRLQELGYYTSRLDGVYLTDDIEAVRAFQKASGLKVDGKAGYDTQTALYSENAVRADRNAVQEEVAKQQTLRYGSEGEEVKKLQNRLITLGYLSGKADGIYGKNTKAAVKEFQKKNNLSADGVAGVLTQDTLYSSKVQDNKIPTTTTLRVGAISSAVADMQNRLIALGYLSGKADGKFGTKTSLALIAFQKANGLTADGIAGVKTLTKLNSDKVTAANGNKTESVIPGAPVITTVNASQVRYANWYTEVRDKVRKLPNATLYDFTTGITWQVNMFSFGAHADAEPITKEDTANMLRAFGGKHTWTPKPVWVVLSDGTVYLATTHDVEHDVEHNLNNDFKGHVCIHFPRTMAQVERIGSYATSHQKAIDLAWEATQQRAK